MHAPRRDAARSFAHRFALFLATALTATGLTTLATVVHSAVVAPPATAATYLGSAARMTLYRPIVDMAATPTAKGYWLVASDGGIFSFGDAHFYGSTGGKRLAQPVVDMTPARTRPGYWLGAADGGVFSFRDAHLYRSAGGHALGE